MLRFAPAAVVTLKVRTFMLLAGAMLVVAPLAGQDSGALINALIRKGILTTQEAEQIRADVARESTVPSTRAEAGNKHTRRLSVGMRMQVQYLNLDTDIAGAVGPPTADHALLRRMYFTLKADLGANWGAVFTYDFVGGGYDDAILEWKPGAELVFNFGLRKVNVGYEERASSGNVKGIERSAVTRYFVESNNGRRLGAASYRIGAFVDGQKPITPTVGFVYGAALTNPERNESFTGSAGAGDSTNNKPAIWINTGLTGRLAHGGTWLAGAGVGFLPDQGGLGAANLGRGSDLTLYSIFTDIAAGRVGLMAEFLQAEAERGTATGSGASPRGFFVQPSLLLTDTIEAVLRYAWLDSDHRGVTLADVVRSAPSGGVMNTFTEWYAGANWYLRGNDLKLQLGAVYGRTRDSLSGAPAEAKTLGVRSQMQVQF